LGRESTGSSSLAVGTRWAAAILAPSKADVIPTSEARRDLYFVALRLLPQGASILWLNIETAGNRSEKARMKTKDRL
jgi:hypothetical protein